MKRIMIFDDDADILDILNYLLGEKGWDVHTRTNCTDIISIIDQCRPDVILMDNWIPDTGGIVATRTIKSHQEFKDIPVIYFSANNDIKKLAEEAGADAWLAKPFELDELERMLSEF